MGAVEQPGVVTDGGGDTDMEAKKPGEAEKAKARKLYAGVQALGYRRDHMEVCTYFMLIGKLIFQCQYFVYISLGTCTYFFLNVILLFSEGLVLKHPI